MANQIYIGNIPRHFEEEEISDIFKDFEYVTLMRVKKNDNKVFAFALCDNEDQVQHVVENLNGIDVGGRKLIVRPNNRTHDSHKTNSTKNDEKYDDENSLPPPLTPIQCIKNQTPNSKGSPNDDKTKIFRDNSRRKYHGNDESKIVENVEENYDLPPPLTPLKNKNQTRLYNSPRSEQLRHENNSFAASHSEWNNEHENDLSPLKNKNRTHFLNPRSEQSRYTENSFGATHSEARGNKFEKNNFPPPLTSKDRPNLLNSPKPEKSRYAQNNSYSSHFEGWGNGEKNDLTSSFNNISISEQSKFFKDDSRKFLSLLESKSFHDSSYNLDKEILHFIENHAFLSVINFPYGTQCKHIYYMFKEFHPIKVWMINNYQTDGDDVTEAVVCLPSDDDATNAMIELDNTHYRRRTLLVQETDNDFVLELMREYAN